MSETHNVRFPRFSVIINVRNGEEFLQEAIDSVIAQEYRDFELLIWNNQSQDGTRLIAERSQVLDDRIRVLESPNPTPLYEARNNALGHAKGKLIAFLDADDIWRADKLSTAAEAFQNPKVSVFFSNFEILYAESGRRRVAYHASLPTGRIFRQLASNYTVCLSSAVYKKSDLEELVGPFNPAFDIIGDFDLDLRLSSYKDFASSDKTLVTYRVHSSNLSSTAQKEKLPEILNWSRNNKLSRKHPKEYHLALASLALEELLAGRTWDMQSARKMYRVVKFSSLITVLVHKSVWLLKNKIMTFRTLWHSR